MKRCNNCVLPETTPNIVFDEKGICNYCKSYSKFNYKGEDELIKLLNKYRRSGSKYDCIVSISGGRDSCYTLLKLAKDYKMKVLAVNYQNPFTDPQAKKNIDNAVKMLDIDLIKFKLKNNVHEKTFRNNFLAWLRDPSPALIPMICIGCKTYYWDIIKIAKKHDIHCIVSGGDPFEDTSFKKELLNLRDEKIENTFIKSIFHVLREILKNPRYFHPVCIPVMIKGYLFGDPYTIGSRLFGSNISRIDLYHYIGWNENEILSRIKSELNWDYPPKLASPWRFDCRIGHLKDLLYLKTLKLTEKDDLYAKMVREGIITRDEALYRLRKENIIYWDEIENLMEEIGINDKSGDCRKLFTEGKAEFR